MKNIKSSYVSGVVSLILLCVCDILSSVVYFVNSTNIRVGLGALIGILSVLALGFYFKLIKGYMDVGNKYSKKLKKSSLGIVIAFLFMILGAILYNLGFFLGISQVVLLGLLFGFVGLFCYVIVTFFFAISVRKIPVISHTKNFLSIFGVLEGISLVCVVGIVIWPFFAFMNFIYKILFLRDTFRKDHDNKRKRNHLWWIISLIVYLLPIIIFGIFILVNSSYFANFDFSFGGDLLKNGDFSSSNIARNWDVFLTDLTNKNETKFEDKSYVYVNSDHNEEFGVIKNDMINTKISMSQTLTTQKINENCNLTFDMINPQDLDLNILFNKVVFMNMNNPVYAIVNMFGKNYKTDGNVSIDVISLGLSRTEEWKNYVVSLEKLKELTVDKILISFGVINYDGNETYLYVDNVRIVCN